LAILTEIASIYAEKFVIPFVFKTITNIFAENKKEDEKSNQNIDPTLSQPYDF
jgi:hypothetical protein